MSLTGPEIDLLREALDDDPADPVFRDVVDALVARGDLRDAVAVLVKALRHGAHDLPDARRLGRLAVDADDLDAVGVAVDVLGAAEAESDPVLARAYALHLDQQGSLRRACAIARRLLTADPTDVALRAVVERAEAEAPDPRARGVDPFYTVARAEAYCEIGRPDLAIRVLRRVLAHRRDDAAVHARLLQLRAQPADPRPWVDDLSEEYWVGQPVQPLVMPAPGLGPVPLPDDAQDVETVPLVPDRRPEQRGAAAHPHFAPLLADDEDTDVFAESALHGRAGAAAPHGEADDEATVVLSDALSGAIGAARAPLPGATAARAVTEEPGLRLDAIDDARAFERRVGKPPPKRRSE